MDTTAPLYLDKRTLRETIFAVSTRTVERLMERPIDPFPQPRLIGGKRFWIKGEVLDWLARQGTEDTAA